jgi:hypothetical protein
LFDWLFYSVAITQAGNVKAVLLDYYLVNKLYSQRVWAFRTVDGAPNLSAGLGDEH